MDVEIMKNGIGHGRVTDPLTSASSTTWLGIRLMRLPAHRYFQQKWIRCGRVSLTRLLCKRRFRTPPAPANAAAAAAAFEIRGKPPGPGSSDLVKYPEAVGAASPNLTRLRIVKESSKKTPSCGFQMVVSCLGDTAASDRREVARSPCAVRRKIWMPWAAVRIDSGIFCTLAMQKTRDAVARTRAGQETRPAAAHLSSQRQAGAGGVSHIPKPNEQAAEALPVLAILDVSDTVGRLKAASVDGSERQRRRLGKGPKGKGWRRSV
ncbi:hypothetical protein CPLU01_07963 [Colletotrichum plurivorum]|uniref:Uncharacterized protein n=1 Tax=Colletotrichum plurivorum TaxID=2175906 RepID=A0A8H6KDP8_9PEZI|nr:hypothetical protein CPLU01_07963 [Colletotrichum plurivorum]